MSIIDLLMKMLSKGQKTETVDVECHKERKYLTERLETLTKELSACIGPVEILEQPQQEISPRTVINANTYDLVIADNEYMSMPMEDWYTLLSRIHKNLIYKYKWTKDIFDCDDIALLYSSILSYSSYKAGMIKQPAFGIAWSNTHAFNVLIDSEDRVWIYEPGSNTVIGRLGNNNGDTYDVKRIWFLG